MDHEWVISNFILDELLRKLTEKFHYPQDDIVEIRAAIVATAELVEPVAVPADSCRDLNDLPVLATAVAGRVEVLVTVDKDLLELKVYRGIPVIKPGEFWRRVEQASSLPNTTDGPNSPE